MSNPYIGQISTFAFNLIPKGWLPCNGQLLAINTNQALFSLLGVTYGGNGQSTFGLPNLQGAFALCQGSGYPMGQAGGEASHTLSIAEMPAHNHPAVASSGTPTQASPTANYPAANQTSSYAATANTTLGTGSSPGGGGQAHPNMPPYLAIAYCIATVGIFPSRQ